MLAARNSQQHATSMNPNQVFTHQSVGGKGSVGDVAIQDVGPCSSSSQRMRFCPKGSFDAGVQLNAAKLVSLRLAYILSRRAWEARG